ncbi:MAG: hypothetical protein CMJ74_06635 [Planctomycetaceae bacterium]|nr:hypothetical protein [Planctomycetaceae bacterium]
MLQCGYKASGNLFLLIWHGISEVGIQGHIVRFAMHELVKVVNYSRLMLATSDAASGCMRNCDTSTGNMKS